jgi:hypothetical protein
MKAAQEAALESFVHGLQRALVTSSALAFIASALALVGLRRLPPGRRFQAGTHGLQPAGASSQKRRITADSQ